VNKLEPLAAALIDERDAIMASWRAQVRNLASAKSLDLPTLNDHMPVWLAELASAMRTLAAANEANDASIPLIHGLQRFEDGFDIEEVVAEYNIMRDCVHDLAEDHGMTLVDGPRRLVNKVFDDAIGAAVKAYTEGEAREVQRRRVEHLAFIAHDLRTPLSAITFAAHILEQRLPGTTADPEVGKVLKALKRNARQLDGLVSNVLKENTHLLTELGVKVERRSFDLWPMVEELLQDMQPVAARAGVRLLNYVPDELEIRADATLLRRILQNLVANAITYTPQGLVTVGARECDEQGAVECWVSDDGKGISRERMHKVFDALEKDPAGDGAGLGLAIVKTFVEAHDGQVTVESAEGKGSTFRFTLPRSTALKAPAEKVPG